MKSFPKTSLLVLALFALAALTTVSCSQIFHSDKDIGTSSISLTWRQLCTYSKSLPRAFGSVL